MNDVQTNNFDFEEDIEMDRRRPPIYNRPIYGPIEGQELPYAAEPEPQRGRNDPWLDAAYFVLILAALVVAGLLLVGTGNLKINTPF